MHLYVIETLKIVGDDKECFDTVGFVHINRQEFHCLEEEKEIIFGQIESKQSMETV